LTAFDEEILTAIEPLRSAGFALHWLHPKSKRPIGEDWSTKPVATLDALRRRHQPGMNLGVRLGEASRLVDGSYLHLIDLDVRDESRLADALTALNELIPGIADSVPTVISGSGGSSRHFYFVSDRPFTSKKLARSDTFKMVFDDRLKREVKRRDWEIELFGTGKQAVMPPSIHPDTGRPYRWDRPFDLAALSVGASPFVASSHLDSLGIIDNQTRELDLKPPLGLSEDEIQDILDVLPLDAYCEDRDGWLQVGMALHHETGGGEDGYDLWCEFSKQSEKFNARDQRIVWNSFKPKANSVRMATLKAVAHQIHLEEMFDEVDLDEPAGGTDVNALIGGPGDADEFDSIIGSATAPTLGWMSLMQPLKDGAGWANTLHNVTLIMRNDPRFVGLPRLNEFTNETVQRTPPGTQPDRRKNQPKPTVQLNGRIWQVQDTLNGEIWNDDRDFAIRAVIEAPLTQGGYAIKVTDRDLKAATVIAANDTPFHPVREYLGGLTWDGKTRVERLFIDYLGAEPNPYTLSIGRLMMVGAVTRVYEPGHKFDFAVILEGLQGKRKSTFIQVLARKWFAELDGDFHDPRAMIETMQGAWILELPELTGFQRSDVRAIKAFISRQKDKARLAYAKRAGVWPRQCIFIGSTNDREYLKDDSGGRRFWPMPCHVRHIDTDRLEREVDQLWAEALTIYRAMRAEQPEGTLPLYLTDPEAHRIAAGLQESRRIESSDDGLAGMIAAWLDLPINDGGLDDVDADEKPKYRDRVCLPQIWCECLRGDPKAYGQAQAQMLGRAMSRVTEWTQTDWQKHGTYGRQRTYERETPLSAAALLIG
jgi:hypothetical protein